MNTPERVIAILDMMASAEGPCGVSELSRALGIGKNNIFRILSALGDKGWLYQDTETKKYGITGAMAEVAFRALAQLDIQKISLPYLQELQQITGETCALSIKVDLERMFINIIQSRHEVSHRIPVGKRLDLWFGSGGKVILAFMTEDEVNAVLDQMKKSLASVQSEDRVVTVESLLHELAIIRNQGFAVGAGERTSGVAGVSAPIFNHQQQIVGCIGVSGPAPRFDKQKALNFSAITMEKAKKISSILGAKA